MHQGPLRINPKNYRQAFIPHSSNYIDVYLPWRNRAFNGDVVAVRLLDSKYSKVLLEDIEYYLEKNGVTDIEVIKPSEVAQQAGE